MEKSKSHAYNDNKYLQPIENPNTHTRFPQMDIVRYVLAISVVIAHFNTIFDCNIFRPMSSHAAVGAFFGLSGFLVYASYKRHKKCSTFLLSRAKRILPSYWFIVLFCAFSLCAISTLDCGQYFTDIRFWKYIAANMLFLNFLQPELPGVFSDNNIAVVNGSLWTLKVEWMLYLCIPVFFYFIKKTNIKIIVAVLVLFLFSIVYQQAMLYAYGATGNKLFWTFSYQFTGQFVYFFTGVICYHYKDYFLRNKFRLLFFSIPSVVICWIGMTLIPTNALFNCIYNLIYPIGIVVTCLVISVAKPIIPGLSKVGNCSYEIYLFHFPVLQCLVNLQHLCNMPKILTLLISLTIIFILSFIVNKFTESIWKKK